MNKKVLSLILVIMLLMSTIPVFARDMTGNKTDQGTNDTYLSGVLCEDDIPDVPSGYDYYGDCFTDEYGNTIYYICRLAGDSGVSRGYWIDKEGNPVIGNSDAEALIPTTEDIKESDDRGDVSRKGYINYDVDRENSSLPSSYDARDLGYVTGFEYQIGGTCYAMASTAALETNAIKQGFADNTLDLNEYVTIWNGRNGYYAGAANNSLNDGYVSSNLNSIINSGGTPSYMGYALLNFSGAVKESTIPISGSNTNELVSSLGNSLNIDNKYLRDITAEEIIPVSSTESAIKQALLDYGGLYIAFASISGSKGEYEKDGQYYTTYYTGNARATGYHAVEMIGWDDNFPKEYFTQETKPQHDGAWLCKNSYGTGWSKMGGYFWMSYDESSVYGATAFKAADPKVFDKVFMYDGAGYSVLVPATKAANIFTADKDTSLTKFTLGRNTAVNYSLSIYKLNKDNKTPEDGTLIYTQQGQTSGKMWTDIYGDVPVKEGERFSIVVENISTCCAEGKSSSYKKFTSNTGESYYYSGEQWIDAATQVDSAGEKKYNNLCIRAVGSVLETKKTCRVDFVCGTNRITKYSAFGLVKLPRTEGYTWVCTYNGEPFNGTGVKHDMTVCAHCYQNEGTTSKTSKCKTEYRCIYCTQEIKTAIDSHTFMGAYRYNNDGTHSRKCLNCSTWSSSENCSKVFKESVTGKDCVTEGYNCYVCDKCGHEYKISNGKYGKHHYDGNKCDVCSKNKFESVIQSLTRSFGSIFQNLLRIFR